MRAACLGPALADFDALLLLRRDALPAADLALHRPRAWRAMAAKTGFRPLQPQDADALEGKRSRAVLRAVPQGEPLLYNWVSWHMLIFYQSLMVVQARHHGL